MTQQKTQFMNDWIRAQQSAEQQKQVDKKKQLKKELREAADTFNRHDMVDIKREIGHF
jgi:hypothetical protein